MTSNISSIPVIRLWLEKNKQTLVRLLVVAIVLLLSVATTWIHSSRRLGLFLGLLLGLCATLVFLRWPSMGLVMLIVANFVIPFSIDTGTQTSLSITMLLLPILITLWLLDMFILKRRIRLAPSRTVLSLLAFVVAAVLSFGIGQLPWFDFANNAPFFAQLGGLSVFLLSAGTFLLMAHQVRDVLWLQRLTWIFLFLGGIYIVGQLLPSLGSLTTRLIHSRATGSLFWTWLVALAASQAIFNRRLHKGWRLALGGLVLGTFYVSLGRNPGWTSGWLPSLVGLAMILLVGFPRLAPVGILIGAAVAALNAQEIWDFLLLGGNRYSLVTRLEAWRILAEIIKVNPVLGLGPANYYWYTPLFPILGWYVRFNSHNNYVDIVAQNGLLGLACFLWFAWEMSRLCWRLRSQVPSGFARAYIYGALGGLIGTLAAGMLADWVLPFVYNIGLSGFRASMWGWLFLGGVLAIDRIAAEGRLEV